MSDYVVIVRPAVKDRLGQRWMATLVLGTIHEYRPTSRVYYAWTAKGAKRCGERAIKKIKRAHKKRQRRELIARRVTGYEEKEGN